MGTPPKEDEPDEFSKFTDEVHDVFARHGIIGMVSFVKVSSVSRCPDGSYDYQWHGQATVMADPSFDLVTVTAGIDSLEQKQPDVSRMLAETKRIMQRKADAIGYALQRVPSN